jgi:two-component system chemotaxis response regulator CheY
LIVDDDAAFRVLLRHLLEGNGFKVVGEAENGAEAVRLAGELMPDVVTMDLEMPVVNGFEATQAICANGGPAVVIVSGSMSSENLGEALQAGARWHVPKRDVGEDLPPVVTALARTHHYLAVR